jgi:hypothetical protein
MLSKSKDACFYSIALSKLIPKIFFYCFLKKFLDYKYFFIGSSIPLLLVDTSL